MYGSLLFRHVFGENQQFGTLKFPATLPLDDGNTVNGIVKRGKPMAFNMSDLTLMQYATPLNFLGFLMENVNNFGTNGWEGFGKFTLGFEDMPARRGAAVSLLMPGLNSIWEFEGPPDYPGGIEQLLVTTGTGAISSSTQPGQYLGLSNFGCWRVVQANTLALAKLLDADLPPLADNDNIRIRLQFTTPAIASAEGVVPTTTPTPTATPTATPTPTPTGG
jgi:hypothetical protein